MTNQLKNYYALQITGNDGEKALCFLKNKRLLYSFGNGGRKFLRTPAPALFSTKKEVSEAINKAPNSSAKHLFDNYVDYKSHKIVRIQINIK